LKEQNVLNFSNLKLLKEGVQHTDITSNLVARRPKTSLDLKQRKNRFLSSLTITLTDPFITNRENVISRHIVVLEVVKILPHFVQLAERKCLHLNVTSHANSL
jgi:hypothetical protein